MLKSKDPSSPGWSRISRILLTIGWCLLGGHSAFAQAIQSATINFNNYDPAKGIDAPVYDVSLCGTKLEGTAFYAQLFGGAVGTQDYLLLPLGSPVNFRTGAFAGYVDVSAGSSVSIPGIGFGYLAVVQLRAWSANGGTTWDAALNYSWQDFSVHYGKSQVLYVFTASGPDDPNIPGLVGLQPFVIKSDCLDCGPDPVCPDPSTMALCLFGIAVGLLCHRKKCFGC
jgi:hypothetical protein